MLFGSHEDSYLSNQPIFTIRIIDFYKFIDIAFTCLSLMSCFAI